MQSLLPFACIVLIFLTPEIVSAAMASKIFIVGATGATGKHVVQMMLEKGNNVVAVARSKDTLMGHLKKNDYGDRLQIHEASLLDLSDEELTSLTKDCSAVVSCLGHNGSLSGIWGNPRRLVTDAVRRLTTVMPSSSKFILMGSEGVEQSVDPVRPFGERTALFLLRYLIPPHADNEEAAAYLNEHKDFDWSVVRPTNLIDEDEASGMYDIMEKSEGPLFGDQIVSRADVAHFMVDLITNEKSFATWKHKMPVIIGHKKEEKDEM
jgi:putative NADH-flavin reductase